jgi:hypothetical protein
MLETHPGLSDIIVTVVTAANLFRLRGHNPGSISIGTVSGNTITFNWTADPNVHLQSATNLTQPVWTDVPNTTGQGSVTVPITPPMNFYRLIGN